MERHVRPGRGPSTSRTAFSTPHDNCQFGPLCPVLATGQQSSQASNLPRWAVRLHPGLGYVTIRVQDQKRDLASSQV